MQTFHGSVWTENLFSSSVEFQTDNLAVYVQVINVWVCDK